LRKDDVIFEAEEERAALRGYLLHTDEKAVHCALPHQIALALGLEPRATSASTPDRLSWSR
jgi:hypothetical protein